MGQMNCGGESGGDQAMALSDRQATVAQGEQGGRGLNDTARTVPLSVDTPPIKRQPLAARRGPPGDVLPLEAPVDAPPSPSPGTPRTTRKLNLMKTLGLSTLQVGKSHEHSVYDSEHCRSIVAMSPLAPDARAVTEHAFAAEPEAALECLAPAVSPVNSMRSTTGERSLRSPHVGASSIHSSPPDTSGRGQLLPERSDRGLLSPHSPICAPQRFASLMVEDGSPCWDGAGLDVSRSFQKTKWGAMGSSVHLESAETKAKKNEAVDRCLSVVRRSSVRAVALCDAPPDCPNVKYVHFMRHGEGTSNSAAREHGKLEYKSQKWKDARLTQQGRDQALDVGSFVRQSPIELEVLLVSPLRRAAVTGCIAFYSRLHDRPEVPILAHELLRERAHGNPCDQRSHRDELETEVPAVDYSLCEPDDPLAHRVGEHGEGWDDTAERSRKWLRWLAKRPEKNVGVATHSAFLLVLFRLVLDCEDELRAWFETGELRSVALVFPDENDAI